MIGVIKHNFNQKDINQENLIINFTNADGYPDNKIMQKLIRLYPQTKKHINRALVLNHSCISSITNDNNGLILNVIVKNHPTDDFSVPHMRTTIISLRNTWLKFNIRRTPIILLSPELAEHYQEFTNALAKYITDVEFKMKET